MSIKLTFGISLSSGGMQASAPPAAPVLSAATNVLDNSFTVNWVAVAGATGYRLDVSTVSNFATFVTGYEDKTVSGTSTSVTGLAMNTPYYYRVRAVNAGGTSENSNAIDQITAYSFPLVDYGNGSVQQTFRIGNSVDCVITVIMGTPIAGGAINTITPYGGAESTINANSCTLPAIVAGLNGYVTVKLAALGDSNTGRICITNAATWHHFYHTLASNGAQCTGWDYAIPNNISHLTMSDTAYSGSAPLPNSLTYLSFNGNSMNWTGLSVGSGGNITVLNLANFRIAKMSSADMITLLTQIANRTGSVPNTITINDYADYASPPAGVTDAVANLKTKKTNVTTVNLGA